jgi:hypothetical protein
MPCFFWIRLIEDKVFLSIHADTTEEILAVKSEVAKFRIANMLTNEAEIAIPTISDLSVFVALMKIDIKIAVVTIFGALAVHIVDIIEVAAVMDPLYIKGIKTVFRILDIIPKAIFGSILTGANMAVSAP